MPRIITMHPVRETSRYGFETTQLYRAKVARNLNVDYLHLASAPQIRDNWKKDIKKLGFLDKEIICVPFSYSDIGHKDPSLRPDVLELEEGDELVLTEDGFVSSVTLGDGSGKFYFTEAPFLFEDYKAGEVLLYNSDGSVALKMKYMDPFKQPVPVRLFYPGYIFLKDDEILAEEDLLVKYLAVNAKQDDLLIRDQHIVPAPNLCRFMENTGKNYYEVIHENILRNLELANLRGKTSYLVAGERLTEELAKLDYDVRFLPPMVTENFAEVKNIGPVTDYCLVGNMQELKNVELVIKTFIQLYNLGSNTKITFYGGTEERLTELKAKYELTPNIKFVGIVDEVPYQKHKCYISASFSELFANAFVEAASQGLLGLLSDVDFAHRYYASQSDSITLFRNQIELVEKIMQMEQDDFHKSNEGNITLARKYSLENVSKYYLDLMNKR